MRIGAARTTKCSFASRCPSGRSAPSSVVLDVIDSPKRRSALRTISPPLAKLPSARACELPTTEIETNAAANMVDFFMDQAFRSRGSIGPSTSSNESPLPTQ